MKLETERLEIIPCTQGSAQIAVEQSYDNGPQISMSLEMLKADATSLGWGTWLVVEKRNGKVIGDIGFKGKPDADNQVEVGYGFLKEYWNKGYATEAVGAIMQWAFATGLVEVIIAETLLDNYGSMRVLEKLDMKKVETSEEMVNWKLVK
ncbi:GNAT family N-acetyltransferase [Psychrobacillus sp. FSL K6-2684]|uniref:GNAT family N-acetyltransferase n=1 Tax=unclassified Psychrobacillus TaxID=2636677 RepID=UPI0030F71232